ncbi:glutamic acid-rich protein-like isoform X1 [Macrosteles quadrilineatus]|uniref:glutamic acid-rich protein-like isoform X1 n=1 Tax=Macrosteles quadrilineatus TaxID=74068 RepID=UPI0023E12A33|nr:glutamic acid-rich protein-like isoform X1 [Macrosteles quadrilineatus]
MDDTSQEGDAPAKTLTKDGTVEEKRPSLSKLETRRSSIMKESGSKKMSIVHDAESLKSLKDVGSIKSKSSKDVGSTKSKSSKVGGNELILDEEVEIQSQALEVLDGKESELDQPLSVLEPAQLSSEEADRDFEEVEEEYEEEIEEDGELKTVTKRRTVKVPRYEENKTKVNIEEEEVEEEYEEEIEEDGEVRTVTKKRIINVPKHAETLEQTLEEDEFEEYEEEIEDENGEKKIVKRKIKRLSYIEREEEYESEEENESGELVLVKKTKIVKIPLRKSTRKATLYEDVIENYDEEIVNEAGEKVVVRQKRLVSVLRADSVKVNELDEPDEKEVDEKEVEEVGDEEVEEEEEIEEEEEVEDEETLEEAGKEEDVDEQQTEKPRRRRKIKIEKVKEGEDEDSTDGNEIKKLRRRKKKIIEKRESTTTTRSTAASEENKIEDEDKEDEEKEDEDQGDEEETITVTSEEIKQAEENALKAQQFESLMKLRTEHQTLRKRTLFLTSKLIQYFRKQKMDHLFTDVRDDMEAEQRFLRKLAEFHECNQRMSEEKTRINSEWETQRTVNEELNAEMKQSLEELMTMKREVAAKLIDPRTGRTVQHDKALEDLLNRQEQQMKQLSECRLVKIKLGRRIEMKRAEGQMDDSGGDFKLMDYEKLASLKEYYTDKITERDIEIGEVKLKIDMMEDNLNVIKDQLKRREDEMEKERMKLQLITSDLNSRRENLNKIKTTKHKTERSTVKIKQQSGLLAYPTLLKDYEEKSQHLADLKTQTDRLKQQYRQGLERIRKLKEMVKKKTEAKYSVASSVSSV